jgi:glutaryl-CoA dehydrogenase
VIGCFGLTEPDFGSDPGGMITRAKRAKGGWILNGAKMWITNGTVADIAIVWARGLEESSGKERIMGFLVEKSFKGFSAPEQKRKHSLRASVTSELILQDVFVPDSHVLPNGVGLKAPLGCLTQARFGIAFGVIGAAMACFESATEYSKSRIMFGKPIGSFQLNTSPWPSGTTARSLSTSPGARAISTAPMASLPSTRSCGTCATSSR